MSDKRRWYQFRLRSLLIAITILGLWAGVEFWRADRERRATRHFYVRGARVTSVFAWDLFTPRLLGWRRKPPVWLQSALGEEYFSEVIGLSVSGMDIDVTSLAWLPMLDALCNLDLSYTNINDAGLSQLGSLKHLDSLSLQGTRVTDQGLAKLASLPQLWDLGIDKELLTPAGVANIRKCPELQSLLVFSSPELNEQQLRRVRKAFPGIYVDTASSK